MSSAIFFNLDPSKILLSGNGLTGIIPNKVLALSNLQTEKLNVDDKMVSLPDWIENIAGKGENAG